MSRAGEAPAEVERAAETGGAVTADGMSPTARYLLVVVALNTVRDVICLARAVRNQPDDMARGIAESLGVSFRRAQSIAPAALELASSAFISWREPGVMVVTGMPSGPLPEDWRAARDAIGLDLV